MANSLTEQRESIKNLALYVDDKVATNTQISMHATKRQNKI